ncbi:MAG: pseudouridine synthase [Alkalispirochaetaceae bacterium]
MAAVADLMGNRCEELEILYEDGAILLADKPSGMIVHPNAWDPKAPNCVHTLARRLGRRVHNVHRLDRATSGVMVFALTSATAAELSRQFREREVSKRYVAVVRGHLRSSVRIDKPLPGREGELAASVSEVEPLCTTVVREPVGRYDEAWLSLLALTLLTGRRHQARRHLRSITHPIIGDRQYGDNRNNNLFLSLTGRRELMLRAVELRFTHPDSGERMVVSGGLPEWWREALDSVGLTPPASLSRRGVEKGE